jgi:hypothetical protein
MTSTRFRSTWLRRLVACGGFALIAVPFATAWPGDDDGENLDPPGDCTKQQLWALKQTKKAACKIDNSDIKACTESDSCEVLQTKENAFRACLAARVAIMDTCFRGGDSGHKERVKNMDTSIEDCKKLRIAACKKRDKCK